MVRKNTRPASHNIKLIIEKQMNADQIRCQMWSISDPKKREQMFPSLAE